MRRIPPGKRIAAVLLFVAAILVTAIVALGGAMNLVPRTASLVIGGIIGAVVALGLWRLSETDETSSDSQGEAD